MDCAYTTTPGDVGQYANTATVDTDETTARSWNTVNVQVDPRPGVTGRR